MSTVAYLYDMLNIIFNTFLALRLSFFLGGGATESIIFMDANMK